MRDIIYHVLKFNSIAVIIGTTGFISAYASLFVDLKINLNIRYFLALLILFISICIIQMKIIYEVYSQKNFLPPITPVKSFPDNLMILCKEHPSLALNSLISIYSYKDGIEQIMGIGYVSNIQTDNLVQVTVATLKEPKDNDIKEFLKTTKIQNLILKTSVPFEFMKRNTAV